MGQAVCFIKFRDHSKLGGITSILGAMVIIQKALKKTEKLSKSCSSLTNMYNTLQQYRNAHSHKFRIEIQQRFDCQRFHKTGPDGYYLSQNECMSTVVVLLSNKNPISHPTGMYNQSRYET